MKKSIFCIIVAICFIVSRLGVYFISVEAAEGTRQNDCYVPFGIEVADGSEELEKLISQDIQHIIDVICTKDSFGAAKAVKAESITIMKPFYYYYADSEGRANGKHGENECYLALANGEILCAIEGRVSNGHASYSINSWCDDHLQALSQCLKDNRNRKIMIFSPEDGTKPLLFIDDSDSLESDENKVLMEVDFSSDSNKNLPQGQNKESGQLMRGPVDPNTPYYYSFCTTYCPT